MARPARCGVALVVVAGLVSALVPVPAGAAAPPADDQPQYMLAAAPVAKAVAPAALSAAQLAVIELAPEVVIALVVRTARAAPTVVVTNGAVPSTVDVVVSVKVTVPEGESVPGPAPEMPAVVSVSWTEAPEEIAVALVARVAVTVAGVIVTVVVGAVAALKLPSPG